MPAAKPKTDFSSAKLARLGLAVLMAFLVLALTAPAAFAGAARYEGSSLDGSVVFFSTDEAPALLGDTDLKADIFLRAFDPTPGVEEFVTRKISTGPVGGNDAFHAFFAGASEDGRLVFFSTAEALVEADTDLALDLYVRDTVAGTTELVSVPAESCLASECGNRDLNAEFPQRGVAADGSRAYFLTEESLAAEDEDEATDIYLRDIEAGTTELVSRGAAECESEGCGQAEMPVLVFDDASADGSRVVFRTEESLVEADSDGGQPDIYVRDLDTAETLLVSEPGTCPGCVPSYGATSGDGEHVIFETSDRIDSLDTDSFQDVYDWSGGEATLVSIGSAGGNGANPATFPGVVSGFPGISADGARIFFETDESLLAGDGDGLADVYERSDGKLSLVSAPDPSCGCAGAAKPASFRWVSPTDPDSAVVFASGERLDPADTDAGQDVYARDQDQTTLLSPGSGDENAGFAGASADGGHVYFVSAEKIDPLDSDESIDIYDATAGTAVLVSAGDASCAPQGCGNGELPAGLTGVSVNGSHAFFATDERLTAADRDGGERDVYQRTAGGTLLVSTGNSVNFGPAAPSGLSTNPPSPGGSRTPAIRGNADAGSSIKVFTNPGCSGEPLRSGSAEALAAGGIVVTVAANSGNSFWLAAEADGLTSECVGPIVYRHDESIPPPGGGEDDLGNGGSGDKLPGKGGPGGQGPGVSDAWLVPRTKITFGPSFKTKRRKVVFRFADTTGQNGTSFQCKLNKARWKRCGSPYRLSKLRPGKQVFQVRGVNARGDRETKPARHKFKVVAR